MKRLAGRQARFANKMEGRTGTLWESRYKVSPIDTDAYLLQCCRYVELNPVKAGMVGRADQYGWSSYRARVGKDTCEGLDVPPTFEALGANDQQRVDQYRSFVHRIDEAREEPGFIGAAVERNQLTGGTKFINEVERRTGIRVEFRSRGRPVLARK